MLTALLSILLLAPLSALTVRAMCRAGVIDLPNERSSHTRPTPKGGGTGPLVAVTAGSLAALVAGAPLFHPLALLAAAFLALLALADDARNYPFVVKLGAQFAAAALAAASGVVLHAVGVPGLFTIPLGGWALPVTIGWIFFTTNAVNFIDGLNGLAAGASLLAALALALLTANPVVAAPCWFLAAGLAGFLPFNYPRARIFMGDVGSQFCGFLLAILSVSAASPSAAGPGLPALTGPLLLSGILFDVAFTLGRRALARERVWQAHRGHLYQLAQRTGIPAPLVAALHWSFVVWGALAAAMLAQGAGTPEAVAQAASAGPWFALPLVLAPQLAWAAYVIARARRTDIGRW